MADPWSTGFTKTGKPMLSSAEPVSRVFEQDKAGVKIEQLSAGPARLAIDLMGLIVSRIQNELPAEERAGADKIIGELKYVYMQLVTNAGPAPAGGEPVA